jgi:hypothetical protein
MSSSTNPTEAMRTAMAVASATFHGEPDLARSLAGGLDHHGAQFALLVISECLTLAVWSLAEHACSSPEHAWQNICMKTEQAIERAHARLREEQANSSPSGG